MCLGYECLDLKIASWLLHHRWYRRDFYVYVLHSPHSLEKNTFWCIPMWLVVAQHNSKLWLVFDGGNFFNFEPTANSNRSDTQWRRFNQNQISSVKIIGLCKSKCATHMLQHTCTASKSERKSEGCAVIRLKSHAYIKHGPLQNRGWVWSHEKLLLSFFPSPKEFEICWYRFETWGAGAETNLQKNMYHCPKTNEETKTKDLISGRCRRLLQSRYYWYKVAVFKVT